MGDRERLTQLARLAQKGSHDAFNELYRLTRDRAYFIAFSIARNEQDVLDILQDAYLKAWQGLPGLQNPEQFSAWLRQITGNAAKDYIKKRKPVLFAGGDEGDASIFDLQAEDDEAYIPDAAMDTAETRRLIMEIIDELPEDQRLCVLLYYYDEIPLGEIAAALDVPLGTAKKRLYLARTKISNALELLEKSGKAKLCGAAPLPLLAWVLRGVAAESGTALPPVILGGSAAGAAAAGSAPAAIVAATASALPQIAAAIAAVAVIAGGSAAAAKILRQQAPADFHPAAEVITEAAAEAPETADAISAEHTSFSLPPLSAFSEAQTYAYTRPSSYDMAARALITRPPAGNSASAQAPIPGTTMAAQPTAAPAAEATEAATTTGYIFTWPTASTTTTTTAATTQSTATTATTAAATTTTTTTTIAAPEPQSFRITNNGVTIEFLEGVLSEDVVLEATPLYWGVEVWDSSAMTPIDSWGISLTSGGASVQPGGSVTVYLPIPAGFTGDPGDLAVYHNDGGTYSNMNAIEQDGRMMYICSYFP